MGENQRTLIYAVYSLKYNYSNTKLRENFFPVAGIILTH